jgi:hypothetical protein
MQQESRLYLDLNQQDLLALRNVHMYIEEGKS